MNGAANWRLLVKINKRKSIGVIFSFILLYTIVGLILDWAFYQPINMSIQEFMMAAIQNTHVGFFMRVMTILGLLSLICGRLFSRAMVMNGLEYTQVTADSADPLEKVLYNTVEEMKIAARLRTLPKIYVVDSNMMNAFATGWNDKNSAIAITRPLLNALSRDELQAVVAHEISHIRNQDIRLISSVFVMSGFLLFIIDVVFRSLLYQKVGRYNSRQRNNNSAVIPLLIVMVLRIVLPIITLALSMFLSRSREMMADAGSVQMTRQNEPLAKALIKIHNEHVTHADTSQQAYRECPNESLRSSSYLYDQRAAGIKNSLNISQWFSSHPSLEERLKAMNAMHLMPSVKKRRAS